MSHIYAMKQSLRNSTSGAVWLPLVAVLASLGLLVAFAWMVVDQSRESFERRERLESQLPQLDRQQEYVSSNRCQACHPGEHASWHRTFHRSMTQVAVPENVLGRFDGSTVLSDGLEYRVYREGDEFWAEMPDPDLLMYTVQGGKRIDPNTYLIKRDADSPVERIRLSDIPRVPRQVVLTTGSHHYQTYWVRGDQKFGNLLQTLPLVYLIEDDRWIPREQAFMHPPNSNRMVTQWNHHCIRCHSTGGVPGLDPASGQFDTRVGEMGISCEACHGPGEEHIRANRDPIRRYRLHFRGDGDPTIVNPSKLGHEASSQVCGQCHGVYIMRNEYGMKYAFEGVMYRPGEDLFKTRYYIKHPTRDESEKRFADLKANPQFFEERWWPDGTVLAGGREFTAMSGAACYTRGEMSCLSCHTMHGGDPVDQLRPDLSDNKSCTQCHQEPKYNAELASHTFHSAETAGSQCVNCHMPRTAYALFGAIRNHEVSIPKVAASAGYGVPNACNLCHLDQTLSWTQDRLGDWYGTPAAYLTTEQRETAASLLWMLKGDAAQRAITVWHFGWPPALEASGADWMAPFVAQLLADPYGVVRYIALKSLRQLPGFGDAESDFLAGEATLRADVERIVAEYSAERGKEPGGQRGPRILFRDNGQIDHERLRQLLGERDDRPVTIKE